MHAYTLPDLEHPCPPGEAALTQYTLRDPPSDSRTNQYSTMSGSGLACHFSVTIGLPFERLPGTGSAAHVGVVGRLLILTLTGLDVVVGLCTLVSRATTLSWYSPLTVKEGVERVSAGQFWSADGHERVSQRNSRVTEGVGPEVNTHLVMQVQLLEPARRASTCIHDRLVSVAGLPDRARISMLRAAAAPSARAWSLSQVPPGPLQWS